MSRKTILLGVLVAAAVGAALWFWWPFGNGSDVLRLSGLVEIQEVRLGSKVGGRVENVLVQEGDKVKAGTPLVTVEVPELRAQREQMQAKVYAAVADLKKARAGPRPEEIDAARAAADGARARLNRVEAGWRPEEVLQAKNELDTSEADLRQTMEEYDRAANLYRRNSIAPAEYEAARAARDRARGRADAGRAHYDMLKKGNRQEDIDEARAEWQRLDAQYRLLKAGTREEDVAAAEQKVAELKARLRELDVSLDEAVVKAPADMLIEVVAVRKGDIVAPNQPVLRGLYADDMWVRVYVPETDLGRVRLHKGTDVQVAIDSYPHKQFHGEVVQINAVSEFTPRNVQSADERRHQVFGVKVRITDPQGAFHAGMAAEVLLPLQP